MAFVLGEVNHIRITALDPLGCSLLRSCVTRDEVDMDCGGWRDRRIQPGQFVDRIESVVANYDMVGIRRQQRKTERAAYIAVRRRYSGPMQLQFYEDASWVIGLGNAHLAADRAVFVLGPGWEATKEQNREGAFQDVELVV